MGCYLPTYPLLSLLKTNPGIEDVGHNLAHPVLHLTIEGGQIKRRVTYKGSMGEINNPSGASPQDVTIEELSYQLIVYLPSSLTRSQMGFRTSWNMGW